MLLLNAHNIGISYTIMAITIFSLMHFSYLPFEWLQMMININ